MSETAKQLLVAVQALPDDEKRELADAVLADLNGAHHDDALEDELNRRWQGYLSGDRTGIPSDVVARKIRAEFGTTP